MPGRRSRPRWLTEEQRQGITLALLKAHLPPEVAPDGFEDLRGSLWTDFTAWRTVPEWEDFEADMNDLRSILWPLMTAPVVWETAGDRGTLMQAATHLQDAWEIASRTQ